MTTFKAGDTGRTRGDRAIDIFAFSGDDTDFYGAFPSREEARLAAKKAFPRQRFAWIGRFAGGVAPGVFAIEGTECVELLPRRRHERPD